ncbi:MBL fold metallo-hydrolase [Candidatus Dependentiae bacterium]|nr:MBL fold metallo-hydrolase [Candidatus Dependentiae bacterium]
MKITFLGAAENVTGSKYLLEQENTKILVDCGLFQGTKEIRRRNWDKFPIKPESIDAVILTHAHIDHSGYIPAFVKNGFKGKIYCSKATLELCSILLPDSGSLQEEDAKAANKYGYSSHRPALPLYTLKDAEKSLKSFEVVDFEKSFSIGSFPSITLIPSHHILGSSFVVISDGNKKITFSGDLSRPNQLIMKDPTHLKKTDFLVLESTYGDRLHKKEDPVKEMGKIINRTVKKGGKIIIPAFAVGRTQTVLYCLYELKKNNAIPDIPIFLDSPMAIDVTDLLCKFKDEHKLSDELCHHICRIAKYTRSVEESKKIDAHEGSSIIIAGSGMVTGGRVLHHLKHFISDSKNTILFVGYQAEETRGRDLVNGEKRIMIHGKNFKVNAEIKKLDYFSAHADYNEILQWLSYFENKIEKVFVTHGEHESALSLKSKIEERFDWNTVVPKYLESFDLD